VEEQRVFGTYGPADPSTVLATLLDGTGVNMLLKDGPGHIPVELVLTQRSGDATPAPITAQDEQIGDDEPSVVPASAPAIVTTPTPATQSAPAPPAQFIVPPAYGSTPPSIPQPANHVLGNPNNVTPTASQIPTAYSVPLDSLPTPSTTVQTQQGIVDTPNQNQQRGQATTPDSVFQQLLQMQKAKATAANPTPPPAAPAPAIPPQ